MKLGRVSKKSIIIACSVIAVAGCGIAYYVNSREKQSGVAWMDSNWLYRRTVSVSNSGSSLTNEDVLIRVDSGSLISQGKLQSDCDDFRFTDSNDGTYLSYWIEGGCNSSDTNIWVRIPTLPSGGKSIYMYYGNSSASSSGLSWGGNVYMYSEGSCPSGWTRASEMDNKFLYGSSTFGQTGGSDTHTHSNATCTTSSITSTNVEVSVPSPFTIHTFTSSGTFTLNKNLNAEVLVVAGGGGGGFDGAGGGGGGGVVYNSSLSLTAGSYSVVVGSGGAGATAVGTRGGNGGNSSFASITAIGGGGGGAKNMSGNSGGSGGGGGHIQNVGGAGTSGQGNAGGTASDTRGGGGGGASGIGASGVSSGNGGTGYLSSISGISQYYGGGGAGGNWNGAGGVGGAGGGGNGGNNSGYSGSEGTPNTGGGGGANGNISSSGGTGKKGGSGIVIIRYSDELSGSGGTITGVTTVPTVSTLSHTHSITTGVSSASNLPSYKNMVLCYKNSFLFKQGLVSVFESSVPAEYTRYSSLDNYFPRGSSSSGSTGGGATHAHNTTTSTSSATSSTTKAYGYSAGSGGSVTYSGGDTIHTFTSSGTFTPSRNMNVEVLVVAGGGGGGFDVGGGGGGGGILYSSSYAVTSGTQYSVVVGGGGAGGTSGSRVGKNGGNSTFGSMTAIGGGGGGTYCAGSGQAGGSGGGGGGGDVGGSGGTGGAGTSGQGSTGGRGGGDFSGGGGGGAGQVGSSGTKAGANGGDGRMYSISDVPVYYGGGGGAGGANAMGYGGAGGGGDGPARGANAPGTNGVANTGGGGGGSASANYNGGNGGSGIVIIRYPTLTAVTVPSSSHTHSTVASTTASASDVPPYKTVIFGKTNSDTYVSSSNILVVSSVPPLGYNRFAGLDNLFTMGSSAYGTTGGASTHTHSVTNTTNSPTGTISVAGGTGLVLSGSAHTHSCTVTSSSASNIPSYYSVIYTQRKESQVITIDGETTQNEVNAPTSLLTNSLTNPTGVLKNPKFSAIFSDADSTDKGKSYQIQVNTSSSFNGTMMWDSGKQDFATLVENGSRTEDIQFPTDTLINGTTYYWRMKVWDNNEEYEAESPWSEVAQFTMNHKPSPTDLRVNGEISPVGVDITIDPMFTAVYNDTDPVDTCTTYQIQMNTTSAFDGIMKWNTEVLSLPGPVANGSRIPPIEYNGTPMLNGITYYWRIKLGDDKGVMSDWSETGTFRSNYQPNKPTGMLLNGLVNPVGVGLNPLPTFSAVFSDPDGTDVCKTYQIQLNTRYTFDGTMKWDSQVIDVVGNVGNNERIPEVSYGAYGGSALSGGTTYYWRIKLGDDKHTQSEWSDVMQFKTNYEPDAPTELLTEGKVNPEKVSLNPTFSAKYTDTDLDNTAVAYQIIIARTTDFAEPLVWDSGKTFFDEPISNGSRTPEIPYGGTGGILEGGRYYWKIRIWDEKDGMSNYSMMAHFGTHSRPSSPTGLMMNGSLTPIVLNSKKMSFSAIYYDEDGDRSSSYQIQISTTSVFDNIVLDSGKKRTNVASGNRSEEYYIDGSSLLSNSGTTYYWRIRFYDTDDMEGEWSSNGIFYDSLAPSSILFEGLQMEGIKVN